jgi:hypothetical protein
MYKLLYIFLWFLLLLHQYIDTSDWKQKTFLQFLPKNFWAYLMIFQSGAHRRCRWGTLKNHQFWLKKLAKIEEIFFIITTPKVLNVLVKKSMHTRLLNCLERIKKNQIINTIIIHPGMMYKNYETFIWISPSFFDGKKPDFKM